MDRRTRPGRPGALRRGAALVAFGGVLTLAASCKELPVEPQGAGATAPVAQPAARLNAAPGAAVPASTGPAQVSPAPSVFADSLTVVWDGLPTLQGVWVAHPGADQARRVRLTNTATGATIDGAIFRREGGDPNAGVVLSAEAARGLGMSPGQEVVITIVALVYGAPLPAPDTTAVLAGGGPETPVPADPLSGNVEIAAIDAPGDADATPDPDGAVEPAEPGAAGNGVVAMAEPAAAAAEAPLAAAEAVATTGDGIADPTATDAAAAAQAIASEAVAAIGGGAPAPEPAAAASAAGGSSDDPRPPLPQPAAAAGGADDTPEAVSPNRDPQGAMAAPATAAVGAEPASGVAAAPEPSTTPEPVGTPESVKAAEPIRPAEPAKAPEPAKAGEAEKTPAPAPARPAPAVAAPAPAPAPAEVAAGGEDPITDGRRFIQAGIFGESANADRLVARLGKAGIAAKGLPVTLGSRAMTRVLAGPFKSQAERDAAMATIRKMGLKDAAPVRG